MSTSRPHAPLQHNDDFDDYFRRDLLPLTRWLIFCGATAPEAQDAIQTAMEAAYANWTAIASPRAFVRTVAMRYYLKDRARARRDLTAQAPRVEPATTPNYDLSAEAEHVRAALASLPPVQRHVMALTIDSYTPSEISIILAKPVDTVRSNLRHARRTLRRRLIHDSGTAVREEAHDGP